MTDYAALIVTFNGEASIVRMINQLIAAKTSVLLPILVVDNASTDKTLACIEQQNYHQVTILKNTQNKGLGQAFNQGINYFNDKQISWVLILDQDSFVSEDFFLHYENLFNVKPHLSSDVIAICSNAVSEHSQDIIHRPSLWDGRQFYVAPEHIDQKIANLPVVHSAISSGTFYRVKSVLALGGFREDYFIDFIDHEFHLRIIRHGKKMIWNQKADFYHNLGIKQHQNELGVWVEHEPFRYYYMARNMAHGYFTYGGIKAWSTFIISLPILLKQIYHHSKVPWEITANIIKGLFHASISRMGENN
ncbi:MAG: glycosyltransferase [gamma proteobacterium symbiont of Taylorina sp.]|nr:glycosyltransferase [gamma proteobacterium symbiont of Taylorina sp.]